MPGAPVLHTNFQALRGVTMRIERGETLGLVGVNGSGKSTLPDHRGDRPADERIESPRGRVSSLLELGAGFHPELTGRENVEVFGTVIGLTVAEIRRRLPEIERFAAIGEFIDQPVKLYSSGMFVRLAFAAAIHVDPTSSSDEALAVGDAVFQHQCLLRIREMQASGTTIVFVSHEMGMIKAVCSRVVLLDAGQILEEGGPAEITSLYFARASAQIAKTQAPHDPVTISTSPAEPTFAADPGFDAQVRVFRHGTGAAKIRRIELLDSWPAGDGGRVQRRGGPSRARGVPRRRQAASSASAFAIARESS